jgi:hypothetical protein
MMVRAAWLNARALAAAAAVVLAVAGSPALAQETVAQPVPGSNGSASAAISGDSLRPDPFLSGPNPDFCVECTWPEGNPTYHGDNGG